MAIGCPAIRQDLRRNGRLCHVFEPMLPQQFTAAGFRLTYFNMAQTDRKIDTLESHCGIPGVPQQRARASTLRR